VQKGVQKGFRIRPSERDDLSKCLKVRNYRVVANVFDDWASSFLKRVPMRDTHPPHPIFLCYPFSGVCGGGLLSFHISYKHFQAPSD